MADQDLDGSLTFLWDCHVRPEEDTETYCLRLFHQGSSGMEWYSLVLNVIDEEAQTYERLGVLRLATAHGGNAYQITEELAHLYIPDHTSGEAWVSGDPLWWEGGTVMTVRII